MRDAHQQCDQGTNCDVQEAVPCPSAPVALSAQESFRGKIIRPFWVVILHKTAHNEVKEMIGGAGTRLNGARSGAAYTSAAQHREHPRERQDSIRLQNNP